LGVHYFKKGYKFIFSPLFKLISKTNFIDLVAMNDLTELTIKQAKPKTKQYKLFDGGGMFLLVHPNGSKYWRMKP